MLKGSILTYKLMVKKLDDENGWRDEENDTPQSWLSFSDHFRMLMKTFACNIHKNSCTGN